MKNEVEEMKLEIRGIVSAMEMSHKKQNEIDEKKIELAEETRIQPYEELKAKIEEMESDKQEFDDMTVNALKNMKQRIIKRKTDIETENTDKLTEFLNRKMEIEERKKKIEKRKEIQTSRGEWSEEQLGRFEYSLGNIQEELTKLDEEQKTWQDELTTEKGLLDLWEEQIQEYAEELGVTLYEAEIAEPELEAEPEAEPEVEPEPEAEPEVEPEPEAEPEPKPEPKPEAEPEPKPEAEPEPKPEPEAEPKVQAQVSFKPKVKIKSLPPIPIDKCMILPTNFTGIEDLKKGPLFRVTKWISEHSSENGIIHKWAENTYNIMLGRKINSLMDKAERTLLKGEKVKAYRMDLLPKTVDEFYDMIDPEIKMDEELLDSYYLQDALQKFNDNPERYECQPILSDPNEDTIVIPQRQNSSEKEPERSSKKSKEAQQFAESIKPDSGDYTYMPETKKESIQKRANDEREY